MSILDEIGRQRTAEYGGAARKDIRALPEKVDENTPKFAIDFLDYYDNPERGQHPNFYGLLLLHEPCTDDELLSVHANRDHIAASVTFHRGRKCCIEIFF